jgi:hypothetical protein
MLPFESTLSEFVSFEGSKGGGALIEDGRFFSFLSRPGRRGLQLGAYQKLNGRYFGCNYPPFSLPKRGRGRGHGKGRCLEQHCLRFLLVMNVI